MQEQESKEQGGNIDKTGKSGCMNRAGEQQGNMRQGVMQKGCKGCMCTMEKEK